MTRHRERGPDPTTDPGPDGSSLTVPSFSTPSAAHCSVSPWRGNVRRGASRSFPAVYCGQESVGRKGSRSGHDAHQDQTHGWSSRPRLAWRFLSFGSPVGGDTVNVVPSLDKIRIRLCRSDLVRLGARTVVADQAEDALLDVGWRKWVAGRPRLSPLPQ